MPSSTSAAPSDFGSLRTLLQTRMGELAPGQQRIARLVLTDPEGTALRTVGQTAELAEVHQSTVVRFATMLGLKGYPALVALCRQHLAEEAHLVSRFNKAQRNTEPGEFLQTALEHDKDNLVRTFTRIQPEVWAQTVDLLAEAGHVHVMGLRKCLPVAQLFTYLLSLIRPDVHLVAPISGGLVDDLKALREGDVFVAISIRRYTSDTVAALEYAHRQGLRTIALTDSAASPLTGAAEISHLVDCDGVTILRSVSAFISLVQAMATEVATRRGARSRDQLRTDEQLLQQFAIYRD